MKASLAGCRGKGSHRGGVEILRRKRPGPAICFVGEGKSREKKRRKKQGGRPLYQERKGTPMPSSQEKGTDYGREGKPPGRRKPFLIIFSKGEGGWGEL